jgi:bifunctional non-homologous end joining protein LigD
MLATLHEKVFDKAGWLFELKWDGYRAIAEIENQTIKLYSRRGNSFAADYPAIMKALKSFTDDVVLDGEIIALKDGHPDFYTLQNHEKSKAPLQYVVFDLLYRNGHDLRNKPLKDRKKILREIFPKHPNLLISEHVEENGSSLFERARKEGFEGIVAKEALGSYHQGRRSTSWLKIKNIQEQEAVIIGYTEPRGSRKHLGALVLGAYDNGLLKYIGHSGGGFTETELKELKSILRERTLEQSPIDEKVPDNSPITWVEPRYVCQVKFTEWTPDGRMRHPIYAGLRRDKSAHEVIVEHPDSKPVTLLESDTKAHFTNEHKIFWPKEKFTKGDVIHYYEKIADIILPYLKDRPESLHRHPNGIEGKSFFHKDITMHVPQFVETHDIWSESNHKDIHYLICQNKETLLYLANLGCIEMNPWNSRIQNLDHPDYIIIDLDPGNNTFDELVAVARIVHEVCNLARIPSYCKTSGKTGLHIIIPTGARYDYDTIRHFSHLIVQIVHNKIPEITSLERDPRKRTDKIYLDYLQNRRGQTIAAPYSIRPHPGATVSTPLKWTEVRKGLNPQKFTIKTIGKRLEKVHDLWAPTLKEKIDLPRALTLIQKLIEE